MKARIPFPQVPQELMAAMMQVEHYVDACGFERRLLELVRLRVSQINACAYCIDMHYKEALAAGEEPVRLYSLPVWRETDYYEPKACAALAWCEAVTAIGGGSPSDDAFSEMRKYFSLAESANMTLAIVQINAWTRLAKAFGFPPGQYRVGAH